LARWPTQFKRQSVVSPHVEMSNILGLTGKGRQVGPQALKRDWFLKDFAARLKPRPFKSGRTRHVKPCAESEYLCRSSLWRRHPEHRRSAADGGTSSPKVLDAM